MQLLSKTRSLCPECLALVGAEIFERDNKVFISKECRQHGRTEEIYWSDFGMYEKARKFAMDGKGIENAAVSGKKIECPKDCGLCSEHKSHSALANMVVTNRCDLNCWYCFFYATKAGYVYEPKIEQVREMARNIASERPIAGNAIQLTGGEPTLREDLVEIIRAIKEEGVGHVQLNTNGIKIANAPLEYALSLREAGINTLYLSFDGVTPNSNPKNHWEAPKALAKCRKAGIGVVLVPTVINTVNTHEIGDIVQFASNNIAVVRGVNFQPVSLVGRMPKSERDKFRVTIPDTIKLIEEQTSGAIAKDDFYPVPTVMPLSRFIESITGKPQYDLSAHFACGMATYVFKDSQTGALVPLTRFLDVEAMLEFLNEQTEKLESGKSRLLVGALSVYKLNSFIDKKKCPKDLKLGNILFNVFAKHDYNALGVFHRKSLFIGMMHFMDLYNYDIERVKRCCIHYVTPSKEMPIIPFCAFNVIPQWYRDKVQKQFGLPISEWERLHGRTLREDLYRRKAPKAETEKERETLEAVN